jgi:hypothetical protein
MRLGKTQPYNDPATGNTPDGRVRSRVLQTDLSVRLRDG